MIGVALGVGVRAEVDAPDTLDVAAIETVALAALQDVPQVPLVRFERIVDMTFLRTVG
ncbi:MAG: hypothetical protein HKO55_07035 [Gammaproteobacteria bacterium]|nr:hypothetical protein [Gammaproteobacteria bacterium]